MNEEILSSLIDDEMIKNNLKWAEARNVVFERHNMPLVKGW